jgi:hypothetical protein
MFLHVRHLIMNIFWAHDKLFVVLDQKLYESIISALLKNTFVKSVETCDIN